jgi:glucans biosynthesis protein C
MSATAGLSCETENEAMSAPASATVTSSQERLAFIDNLRWVVIVFVVSMHAAVTYSHVGSWYFMEDPKPGPAVLAIFATYQAFLQAFFMGLLFFIAGYFIPEAFNRKGFGRFLRDRAMRLGVPALIFMLVIQPVTVYWLLRDFARLSRPSLFHAYWPYLSSGRFLSGSGPMWFAVALLLFSLVYALIRVALPGPQKSCDGPLPTHSQIFAIALLIAVCTFLVRIVQPIGTNILNMQLCFFSQYIVLFALGISAKRRNWLLRIPYDFGMRWFNITLSAGTIVWLGIVFSVFQSHSETAVQGGFTWQSAALSFWESFFCVGICLGLLVLFRDKFNRQNRLTGWLSDNCFAVYMFHTPLLIAVTLCLRDFAAPKLVKFLCATILGVAVTYLASSFIFRRTPLLKRVL